MNMPQRTMQQCQWHIIPCTGSSCPFIIHGYNLLSIILYINVSYYSFLTNKVMMMMINMENLVYLLHAVALVSGEMCRSTSSEQ